MEVEVFTMLSKISLFVLLLLTTCYSLNCAKDCLKENQGNSINTNMLDYKNKFGASFSNYSGYGFSYSRSINYGMSAEFIIGAFTTTQGSRESLDYTLGFELHKDLYTKEVYKVYGLFAIGHFYSRGSAQQPQSITNISTEKSDNNIGLGIGFEYSIVRNCVVNIEAGYMYNMNFRKDPNDLFFGHKQTEYFLGVGAGFYYAF